MSVNFDHTREARTGIPEVIIAESKRTKDLIATLTTALKGKERVLVTRVRSDQIRAIDNVAKEGNFLSLWDDYQQTVVLSEQEIVKTEKSNVMIIAAGTSDMPIVEEIKTTLLAFGLGYMSSVDVGVAGMHRHKEALQITEENPDIKIIIVVAGAEGALFSVIAAQTKLPVVAVPVSTGYGFGGKGETALRSALQSCAPGIATVNIDNGFGAASFVVKLIRSGIIQ